MYIAYGLVINSEIVLPELDSGAGEADVVIRQGEVPTMLPDAITRDTYFETGVNELLLKIPDIGRFRMLNGSEIIVHSEPKAKLEDVRAYLLGSCLAALLHQRDFLTIHASAIRTSIGGVLFAGHSGSGKSTLAMAFLQRQYDLVADDVCAITKNRDGAMIVMPAVPRAKLSATAASNLGIDTKGMSRAYSWEDKVDVPVWGQIVKRPLTIARIYILRPHHGSELAIEPVEGFERVSSVLEHTYREQFLTSERQRSSHLALAVEVARTAECYTIHAPRQYFSPVEISYAIERSFPVTAANPYIVT